MNKKVEVAIEMAKKFNSRAQAMKIDVPTLVGFKDIPTEEAKIVFAAGDDYCLEQFITDGFLNEKETFDDRVKESLDGIKKVLVDRNLKIKDEDIQLLGDFSNGIFTFRVYLQYIPEEKNPICQVIVYFLDPKNKAFYQLTLSMIVTGNNTVDDIFYVLREKIVLILDGIKYREEDK